ncbi:hypothetical protein P7C70_g3376, partial [Phenoliferia sp. Uapishka_3]
MGGPLHCASSAYFPRASTSLLTISRLPLKLAETPKLFCIAWEGTDPATGNTWQPTWVCVFLSCGRVGPKEIDQLSCVQEPRKNVLPDSALRREWNEEKKRRREEARCVKTEVKDEDEDVKPIIARAVREEGVDADSLRVDRRGGLGDDMGMRVEGIEWDIPPPPESEEEYESDQESLGSERNDDDFLPDDLARAAAARFLPVELPFIAQVVDEEAPLTSESAERLASVDASALSKIRRALALAKHTGTGEAEAKRAFKMVTQLIARENLSMADIIASESEKEQDKRAGMTVVRVTTRDGAVVRMTAWIITLMNAVDSAFLVKSYYESFYGGQYLHICFYGLATNAAAAASAYEMVQNLALEWSLRRKDLKGRVAFSCYRQGVARGIYEAAEEERIREEEDAEALEQKLIADSDAQAEKLRTEEVARLEPVVLQKKGGATIEDVTILEPPHCSGSSSTKASSATAPSDESESAWLRREAPIVNEGARKTSSRGMDYENEEEDFDLTSLDSDDDDGSISDSGGGDDRWTRDPASDSSDADDTVKAGNPGNAEKDPPEASSGASWTSSAQLALFRSNAGAIADSFLKSQGIELRTGRRRKPLKYDPKAYNIGKEDSKKIDLKRKRIDEGTSRTRGRAKRAEGGHVLKQGKKIVKVTSSSQHEEDQEGFSHDESDDDQYYEY